MRSRLAAAGLVRSRPAAGLVALSEGSRAGLCSSCWVCWVDLAATTIAAASFSTSAFTAAARTLCPSPVALAAAESEAESEAEAEQARGVPLLSARFRLASAVEACTEAAFPFRFGRGGGWEALISPPIPPPTPSAAAASPFPASTLLRSCARPSESSCEASAA